MIYLGLAAPWVIVLVLLWALVAGQPAATADLIAEAHTRGTETAFLRATVVALEPTAPRPRCYFGTAYVPC